MVRLSALAIVLMGALSVVDPSSAGVSPDKAPGRAETNNKLLNTVIALRAEKNGSEWDLSNPKNLAFYNVRKILARQELMSLEHTINARVHEIRRSKQSVDSSA